MNTLTLPQTDVVGTVEVTTWLDESKGTRSYRTEVSHVDARARGGIWLAVAETAEKAAKNHAAGLIQAAEVEIAAWLGGPDVRHVPAAILVAGRTLGMDAPAIEALRERGPDSDEHRRRAAELLAALERE